MKVKTSYYILIKDFSKKLTWSDLSVTVMTSPRRNSSSPCSCKIYVIYVLTDAISLSKQRSKITEKDLTGLMIQGVPSQNVFFKRAKNVRKSICR